MLSTNHDDCRVDTTNEMQHNVANNSGDSTENLERLWQLTEQARQYPLIAQEATMRALLQGVRADTEGALNQPLTALETAMAARAIEACWRHAPFAGRAHRSSTTGSGIT